MKLAQFALAFAISTTAALSAWGSAVADTASTTSGGSFYINYQITLPTYPVSDLVLFEQGAPNPQPNGYGVTFGGCCELAQVGTTVITDPFVKTDPIISNFILGITSDLPNDAPGQQHLVLFTNDTFAAGAQGIAFGTLFPNTDEDTLITDITTNLDDAAVGDTVYNRAVNDLFTFANGDATTAGIGFGSGSTFTAVAFSSGQIIGGGASFTTPAASAAPEPAEWALMLLGVAGLGLGLRAHRKAHRNETPKSVPI